MTAQRKALLDYYIHFMLNTDRLNKNYICIERLWNASGLTNKALVEELLSDRENAADDFKDSIFWDMIWLLKDEIAANDALRTLFSDLYAKRFPKVDQFVKELEKRLVDGKKVVIKESDYTKFLKKNYFDEASYFLFRVCNSEIIFSNNCIEQSFLKSLYHFVCNNFQDTEIELCDNDICFTDSPQTPVFSSSFFQKFVQKQKQALADYLQVEADKLSEFYDHVMTIGENPESEAIAFHSSAFGLISAAMIEMIWLQGGSSYWLTNIQSLNRKNKLGYRYRPDFNRLFEKYCRASIRIDYLDYVGKGQPFTPFILARNCAFSEMEALAVSMGYMYMSDCLYQMYKQMQKQYYESFSWESFRNKDLKTRYEEVIADLKASLSSRDHQLQNLGQLYSTLKGTLEKKNDLALIKEVHEKDKILKIADEKDVEIQRLNAIIASQNQLIEQLQILPPDNLEKDLSIFETHDNIIYQHRYLFVGDITNLGYEDLRKKFPSSVFMNSNTTNISQIQVDAVVYLIQAMSHSMYYKCKNTPALLNARVIYFNGRGNMAALLETIAHEMQL